MQAMSHSVWLTIDIGNSAVKAGAFVGSQIVETISGKSAEEVSARIATWDARMPLQRIGLCSVVPQHSELLVSRIKKFTDAPIFEVNSESILPIQINYTPLKSLGPDRLAAACAAWYPGGNSTIVVDAGTAITIDVVSTEGVFLGGVIMPGPVLTGHALANYTANLPSVLLTPPEGAFGNSTTEALQHGIIHGMSDGVLGIITRIKKSLDTSPTITLTGGWSQLLADKIPGVRVNQNLVLHGIRALMQLNAQPK